MSIVDYNVKQQVVVDKIKNFNEFYDYIKDLDLFHRTRNNNIKEIQINLGINYIENQDKEIKRTTQNKLHKM